MQDKAYIVKTKEVNIDELNQTLEELQRSNKVLNDRKLEFDVYITEINERLEEYKKSNKKYIKKIITASLSILISLSISYGIVKNTKNSFSYYDTTKYTYTDGKLTEEKVESDNSENEAYITEYGYWNEEGTERKIKEYDVSEYTFEDIKDYLNLDLTNIEYDIKTQEFSDLNSTSEVNNEGQTEITTYIKDENVKYDKLEYIKVSSAFILLQMSAILLFETIKIAFEVESGKNDYYILGCKNLCLIEDFLIFMERKIKEIDYESLVVYYNKIKEPLSRIINEIEKNEELRNRFVELFNENKYLLNEPNILLEKYNETLKEFDLLVAKTNLENINKSLKKVIK